MLVLTGNGPTVARALAEQRGIADRVEVFDVEQFIALNVYELGGFESGPIRTKLTLLVERYNEIVEANETDPSIRIALR